MGETGELKFRSLQRRGRGIHINWEKAFHSTQSIISFNFSCVVWKAANSSNGFRLPYPSIIVHAVSVDLSSFPHEHILVLIDANKAGARVKIMQVPLCDPVMQDQFNELFLTD